MINRRQFLKTSLSGITLAAFPSFSFSQTNPDVVVIGAGSSGLAATAELIRRGIPVLQNVQAYYILDIYFLLHCLR